MNENNRVGFLTKELEKLISSFKLDRDRHKKNALRIKLSTAILTASATVLLGWEKPSLPDLLKNIALVLNAAITVFAA